jgi:hypothetical protein
LGSLYRRKYDAAKTVAKFSMTLRAETDLDRLREQLLAVVEETMQQPMSRCGYVSLHGVSKSLSLVKEHILSEGCHPCIFFRL